MRQENFIGKFIEVILVNDNSKHSFEKYLLKIIAEDWVYTSP